jgi:hypothetical protein
LRIKTLQEGVAERGRRMPKAILTTKNDETDELTPVETFALGQDVIVRPAIPGVLLYCRSLVTIVPGDGYIAWVEEDQQGAN